MVEALPEAPGSLFKFRRPLRQTKVTLKPLPVNWTIPCNLIYNIFLYLEIMWRLASTLLHDSFPFVI